MSNKVCPYCAEEIRIAAIKCRFCGSMLDLRPGSAEWLRDRDGRLLTGVCAGLARQFGLSITAIRLAFVLGTFLGGWGLLIYLALWVIMPVRQQAPPPTLPAVPEAEPAGPAGNEPPEKPTED